MNGRLKSGRCGSGDRSDPTHLGWGYLCPRRSSTPPRPFTPESLRRWQLYGKGNDALVCHFPHGRADGAQLEVERISESIAVFGRGTRIQSSQAYVHDDLVPTVESHGSLTVAVDGVIAQPRIARNALTPQS